MAKQRFPVAKPETKRGRRPSRIPWTPARRLFDAGCTAADAEAYLAPPSLEGLPDDERLRREAELGAARLRVELLTTVKAKAFGRGRVSRKVSVMTLLAACRAHLGWDRVSQASQEPPDLEGAKVRLLALWEQQRKNLLADGHRELKDGSLSAEANS